MSISGEQVLAAVRRAVEIAGVDVATNDTLPRLKLERALEAELQRTGQICSGCGDLDWDEEE